MLVATRWSHHAGKRHAPLPEPDPMIDPNEPVPNDPAELLADAPEPLPPAPIESTPNDPAATPTACPSPPDH
jgi:hypothetical protein